MGIEGCIPVPVVNLDHNAVSPRCPPCEVDDPVPCGIDVGPDIAEDVYSFVHLVDVENRMYPHSETVQRVRTRHRFDRGDMREETFVVLHAPCDLLVTRLLQLHFPFQLVQH